MNRFFKNLSTVVLGTAAMALAGCLGDVTYPTGGGDTAPEEVVIPDNSTVDASIFDAVDLNGEGLEAAKSHYEADNYWLAAQALQEYWRNRSGVANNNVNLIAPTISADEQVWADAALQATADPKDGYRFYTEGYLDGDKPYSYQSSNSISWDKRLKEAEAEESYRLHRLQWFVAQGKAYRTSLDEKYVEGLIKVFESWREKFVLPGEGTAPADPAPAAFDYENGNPATDEAGALLYAWRPIDVAMRLDNLIDTYYYIAQSKNITPQFFATYMSTIAREADYVMGNLSESDDEARKIESHALFRAGKLFPEMKSAAEWVEKGGEDISSIDPEIFGIFDLENNNELHKVKSACDMGDYYAALEAIKDVYMARKNGLNPDVDITTAKATDTETSYANYALAENGYCFYVKNYFGPELKTPKDPTSYKNADGGINWQLWPTGEQEERYQLHRWQWMVPQAKAYNATKDERYAENWKEVVQDWMRQNPRPTVDFDFSTYPGNLPAEQQNYGWTWRSLDVAARLIDLCALVEYYQTSPVMTPEWIVELYDIIAQHADHIMNNYSADSNHLITQAQAVTFAGMLFPELEGSRRWRESGTQTLATQIKAQYFGDGWLMDGDFHYHISAIPDFRESLLVAQLNGAEQYLPADFVESMRKMCGVVMNMVYPDYSAVNMADTRQTWNKSVLTRNLRNYAEMFPEWEEMKWYAYEGAQGTKPTSTLAAYPDCGYYVMRTGWEHGDMMMVLQNATEGPDKRWHRQWDNNTFEFYMNGRRFFMDSGCYSYGGTSESNRERAKYAATTAHNTLTLNDGNCSSAGVMLGTGTGKTAQTEYEWLTLENPSYAGLTHRRTAFRVGDKFFVLLDEAYGSAEGKVSLHFHATEGSDSEVAMHESGFRTNFADQNNITVVTLAEQESALVEREGFLSKVINESVARKAYSLDIAKSASDEVVRYITVITPSGATKIAARAEEWNKKGTNTIKVTVDDTTYTLTYKL